MTVNKNHVNKKNDYFNATSMMSRLVNAREFINRGISSMLLFGDKDNPSNKFYERMGAEKLFAKTGEFHGGYGWKNLQELTA